MSPMPPEARVQVAVVDLTSRPTPVELLLLIALMGTLVLAGLAVALG